MADAAITRDSIPVLRRGVRRQFDNTRNAAILMAPERVIVLDEIADAIVEEFKPAATVGDIVANLATRFGAPAQEVEGDVVAFIRELIDKGLIVL
ncbi:MAG: pyrroloquinoline quinone biosynthesis protein PqqD [Acidocella sp. 20-61-6]|nr:MAG: pyrroloquinoline quinone biosynthesis protein PqqD [Acidocella sp. 20-61-6]